MPGRSASSIPGASASEPTPTRADELDRRRRFHRRVMIGLPLMFLGLSVAWIYFSDLAVLALVDSPARVRAISTIKGWVYVTLASLLLFVVLWIYVRHVNRYDRERLERTRFLQQTLAALDEVVLVVDPGTRTVVDCNDAIGRVFGYQPDELIGQSLRKIHTSERTFETFGEQCLPALESRGVFEGEWTFRRRDGSPFIGRISIRCLDPARGLSGGVVGAIRDIDTQRRAEQALRDARDQLEQRVRERTAALKQAVEALRSSNEELEAFAYSASHDLRAPLRAIRGFAEILVNRFGEGLPETGRRYANRIASAAERMDRLIEDLLSYSQLGREGVRPRRVDPCRVLDEAIEALGSTVREKGARIHRPDAIPPVQADPELLRRVFQNLLENALKYGAGKDGRPPRIEISAQTVDASRTFGSETVPGSDTASGSDFAPGSDLGPATDADSSPPATTPRSNSMGVDDSSAAFGADEGASAKPAPRRASSGWVEIHVRDYGPGIAAEHASKVFEMFQRLSAEEEGSGTGIGLALVRKACRTLAGDVRLNPPCEGPGARFTVRLPRAMEARAVELEAGAGPSSDLDAICDADPAPDADRISDVRSSSGREEAPRDKVE